MPKDPNRDYPKVQFYLTNPETAEAVAARSREGRSENMTARRDLERYYALLGRVMPVFNRSEAHLLVDIFNGTIFEPIEASLGLLYASVDEAEEGYFEKHGVDRSRIVKRIHEMGPAQQLAIIDAVERFWNDPEASVESVGLCGPSEVRN